MADMVLLNGKIFTVDAAQPWAQAVAIRDGKFVAVGKDEEIKRLVGKETEVIDLQGKLALPGFNDAHLHFTNGGLYLLGIDLRPARDEKEFARILKEYIYKTPKGEWVTGGNWDHENWPSKKHPRREMIDPFTADHPVLVSRLDGHMALANSLALKLAGITRDTPDPQGGEIVKDKKTGEPTGILRDNAMDLVDKVIPPLSRDKRERAIRAAMRHAQELGVTSVQDNSSRRGPGDLPGAAARRASWACASTPGAAPTAGPTSSASASPPRMAIPSCAWARSSFLSTVRWAPARRCSSSPTPTIPPRRGCPSTPRPSSRRWS